MLQQISLSLNFLVKGLTVNFCHLLCSTHYFDGGLEEICQWQEESLRNIQ